MRIIITPLLLLSFTVNLHASALAARFSDMFAEHPFEFLRATLDHMRSLTPVTDDDGNIIRLIVPFTFDDPNASPTTPWPRTSTVSDPEAYGAKLVDELVSLHRNDPNNFGKANDISNLYIIRDMLNSEGADLPDADRAIQSAISTLTDEYETATQGILSIRGSVEATPAHRRKRGSKTDIVPLSVKSGDLQYKAQETLWAIERFDKAHDELAGLLDERGVVGIRPDTFLDDIRVATSDHHALPAGILDNNNGGTKNHHVAPGIFGANQKTENGLNPPSSPHQSETGKPWTHDEIMLRAAKKKTTLVKK